MRNEIVSTAANSTSSDSLRTIATTTKATDI